MARWRAAGNLLYFEKAKRLADPKRPRRSNADVTIPIAPGTPENTIKKGTLDKSKWYNKVENKHDPIGEIPDNMLDFQLMRHRLSPDVARTKALPPGVELDHQVIPQRVFYDLCMRGLVKDDTLVDISRKWIPADQFDDWLAKMTGDEAYLRAIRLRDGLNHRLRQASGLNLFAKDRTIHAVDDAYAKASGVSFMISRLRDSTYIRDMAGVPAGTLQYIIRQIDPKAEAPLEQFLRWTINQEISCRNLLMDDLPGGAIPRDFRAGLEDYLKALRTDPDPKIKDVGRRLPTEERQQQLIRFETWNRSMNGL